MINGGGKPPVTKNNTAHNIKFPSLRYLTIVAAKQEPTDIDNAISMYNIGYGMFICRRHKKSPADGRAVCLGKGL